MTGRRLAHQGLLFALIGLAATAVHVAVAFAVRDAIDATALQANFAGYCAAVGVSYFGNARWTFRRDAWRAAQFVRFLVLSLSGLIANQAITYVLVERLGWPFWSGLVVVVIVVPILSFLAARLWAFREPSRTGPRGPAP